MEKTEDIKSFGKVKDEYQISSSVNDWMANSAKAVVNPKKIIEVGIDKYHQLIQQQLNQSLYQYIVKDNATILHDILCSRNLNENNAFTILQQRIEDQEIPVDMRMQYVSTLVTASTHYFNDMAKEVETFKSMAVDINDNQKILFEEIKNEFSHAAIHFKTIEDNILRQSTDIDEFNKYVKQINTKLFTKVTDFQRNIGDLNIKQETLFEHQNHIMSHVNDIQNMVSVLFDAHTHVDIKGFENEDEIQTIYRELNKLYQQVNYSMVINNLKNPVDELSIYKKHYCQLA